MEDSMTEKIELQKNQTILFIGDSITDASRLDPAYRPYGYGYVHFVANRLLARYPELNLKIINTGISGNTVFDLERRWENDCLQYKPDVLSVLVGINDVWRQSLAKVFGNNDEAVGKYELTYNQLLLKVQEENNCQIILAEPFMFCNDRENPTFMLLQDYIKVVERLAEKFGAIIVPLQKLINQKIEQVKPERWSEDTVHPYQWAHEWIAQQWIKTVGLE
jgi:acyl-CoA thioesterase-1